MKRFLIVMLSLLLIAGTFACGGDGGKTTPEQQPTAKAEVTPAPVAENTVAPVETPEPTEEPAPTYTAGKYGISKFQAETVVLEGEMLVTAGVSDTYLTLNTDHTGTLIMMGQELAIGWTD
ncbi:MAG: hypothetical protein IJK54_09395 [Clostridia bacterium]|nr:hypothetical protein [Clostridia bacterium]